MSSEIKRYDSGLGMEERADGQYVLQSDHEAEVARLRAEVEAYRSKIDELSMLHVAATQDKAHLEIKYRNACNRSDKNLEDAKRWRHARTIFSIEDIQIAHGMRSANPSEEANLRADQAIDAAMGEGK